MSGLKVAPHALEVASYCFFFLCLAELAARLGVSASSLERELVWVRGMGQVTDMSVWVIACMMVMSGRLWSSGLQYYQFV